MVLFLVLTGCAPGLPGDPRPTVCLVEWKDAERAIVVEGFQAWERNSRGRVAFSWGCEEGSLRVMKATGMVSEHGGYPIAGKTDYHGQWIRLDPSYHDLRYMAMHEMGHYLTGYEHSSHPVDIMYESQNEATSPSLTEKDLDRLNVIE